MMLLLLFAAGLFAGVINILAGGGSFLTLPLLILSGLSPTVANGTNRIGILIQNLGAIRSFKSHGIRTPKVLHWQWVPALFGAPLGVWFALNIDEALFEKGLALAMAGIALWTFWKPGQINPKQWLNSKRVQSFFFFLAGIYGGFVQAGVGFLLLTICAWAGVDLVRSNAFKVRCILAFNILALIGFAWAGEVVYLKGIVMGLGMLIGGQLGVRLNVKKGHVWVKQVVVIALLTFALLLWLK